MLLQRGYYQNGASHIGITPASHHATDTPLCAHISLRHAHRRSRQSTLFALHLISPCYLPRTRCVYGTVHTDPLLHTFLFLRARAARARAQTTYSVTLKGCDGKVSKNAKGGGHRLTPRTSGYRRDQQIKAHLLSGWFQKNASY